MKDFLTQSPWAPVLLYLAFLMFLAGFGTGRLSCEVRIHSTTQPTTENH